MTTQGQLVRDWARARGYEVGVRGRIAPAIWEAYAEAHEGFERESPDSGTASCVCGRRWTGLKECHCRLCHRHFSTVDNFDAHMPSSKCIDPLEAKLKGGGLREKQTVWGVIYVRDGEHWKVNSGNDAALF